MSLQVTCDLSCHKAWTVYGQSPSFRLRGHMDMISELFLASGQRYLVNTVSVHGVDTSFITGQISAINVNCAELRTALLNIINPIG